MIAPTKEYAHPVRLYALIALTAIVAFGGLLVLPWAFPSTSDTKFWNGLIAFTLLAIACDTSFLRMSFANINSSVAFVPFLASVMLFAHPWPMILSGATAAVVDTFVRRKPPIRIVFNTAQYMLAVGIGQLLFTSLGGRVDAHSFSMQFMPFVVLVAAYFLVNSGSVTLAVSFASGISIRESWSRLIGTAFVYDIFSSSLGLLLAFLYVRLEFAGLAVLLLPLFFVRHIYEMNQRLEQKNREQLNLMVRAMEARDPYTSGHSVRVSEYARAMARELGLSAKQMDNVETAALLHDVGKMYEEFVPLLRKEGKLTADERRVMQSHPARGAELVSTSAGLRGEVERAIRHHHENFDGSGYPDGLAGDAIPKGARVIMIADTLDAMTTDRPYRKALGFDRVVQELVKHSGTQFDPDLVRLVIHSPVIRRLVDGTSSPRAIGLAADDARRVIAVDRMAVG
jgi:putative nucleotidyltransferase with HDIG domain